MKTWIVTCALLLLPGWAWASPGFDGDRSATTRSETVQRTWSPPTSLERPLQLGLRLELDRQEPTLPDLQSDLRLPSPGPDSVQLSLTVASAWSLYVTADLDADLPRLDAVDGETYFTVGTSLRVTRELSLFVEDFQPASMVIGGADEEPAQEFSWDGHQVSAGLRVEIERLRLEAAAVLYALSVSDRRAGIGAVASISVGF